VTDPIEMRRLNFVDRDPKFQQEWMAFLDQRGGLLAKADADG
jgi:hypothetical protein